MTRRKAADASVSDYMGIRDLAVMFDVSQSTAYELVKRNQLPSLRVRSAIRIPRAAVQAFIAANTTGREQ